MLRWELLQVAPWMHRSRNCSNFRMEFLPRHYFNQCFMPSLRSIASERNVVVHYTSRWRRHLAAELMSGRTSDWITSDYLGRPMKPVSRPSHQKVFLIIIHKCRIYRRPVVYEQRLHFPLELNDRHTLSYVTGTRRWIRLREVTFVVLTTIRRLAKQLQIDSLHCQLLYNSKHFVDEWHAWQEYKLLKVNIILIKRSTGIRFNFTAKWWNRFLFLAQFCESPIRAHLLHTCVLMLK